MIGELTADTQAGARMVDLAEKHAPDFASRAAMYDAENRFVRENFDAMRRSGFLAATVPAEHGGLGVESVRDITVAVSRLARACPATAIAVNMHLGSSWNLARAWRSRAQAADDPAARTLASLLRILGRGRLIMAHAATEPGTSLMFPATEARRADGGYVINGRKIFVTNSDLADIIVVFLRVPDESGGYRNGTAVVRSGTPGLHIDRNWDALGMRGSGSHNVTLRDCVVPADAVLLGPPLGELSGEAWAGLLGVNFPLVGTYLGIAEAACEAAPAAVHSSHRRGSADALAHNPLVQTQVAEHVLSLTVMRATLGQAGSGIDAGLAAHDVLTASTAYPLICDFQCAKLVVNQAAVAVVDRAMTIVGGRSYLSDHVLSRLYRDVRAGGFMQPFAPDEAREFIGKVNIGLDPFSTA